MTTSIHTETDICRGHAADMSAMFKLLFSIGSNSTIIINRRDVTGSRDVSGHSICVTKDAIKFILNIANFREVVVLNPAEKQFVVESTFR